MAAKHHFIGCAWIIECVEKEFVVIFDESCTESSIENSNNLDDMSKQYLISNNYCLLIHRLTVVNSIPCRLQAIMFFVLLGLKTCLLVRKLCFCN